MRKNYFAQNLKTFREENEWTQAQLAEKLKIHPNSVGAYERKVSEPSLSVLIRISMLTKISIDDFVFIEFEKEEKE